MPGHPAGLPGAAGHAGDAAGPAGRAALDSQPWGEADLAPLEVALGRDVLRRAPGEGVLEGLAPLANVYAPVRLVRREARRRRGVPGERTSAVAAPRRAGGPPPRPMRRGRTRP